MHFYIYICIYILCISLVQSETVSNSQISGLQYLYNNTGGPLWAWKTPSHGAQWDFITGVTPQPCADNWQGVTCSVNCSVLSSCDIIELKLSGYNLRGQLPDQLDLLMALSELDLSENPLLGGPIPDSLGSLTNLIHLILDTSGYTGTFPSSLGNLTKLKSLNLVGTNCTGSIPDTFVHLKSLNFLDISVNPHINGTFPSFIATFDQLSVLYLMYNSLSGTLPAAMGNMSSLVIFMVDDNRLSGSIPSEFGHLTQLEVLDLSLNYMTGSTLPTTLGGLTSMSFLALQDMGLTGSIPESFFAMTSIENLYLGYNQLSGGLSSPGVGNLTSLVALFMEYNSLTGPLPEESWSPHLAVLDIEGNQFSGSLPLTLLDCVSMTEVSMAGNRLFGRIPPQIVGWQQLTFLELSSNSFSGSLPSEFALLTNLNTLLMSQNTISGHLSAAINSTMTNLRIIDVSSNRFSGTVNLPVLGSDALNSFIISKNCFTGTISDQICSSVHLQVLVASGLTTGCAAQFNLVGYVETSANPLAGDIPGCVFNMSELTQLFMDGNGLRGNLAPISSKSQLRNMSLSYNRLTGTIPVSVQQYTGFEVLDLSYNHFNGTIQYMDASPNRLFKKSITADGNRLSGLIPSSFTFTSVVVDILDGNMFNCRSRSTLPQSDPVVGEYTCGAQKVSDPLYFYSAICAAILILFTVLSSWKKVGSGLLPKHIQNTLSQYFPVESWNEVVSVSKTFLFRHGDRIHYSHPAIDLVSALMSQYRRYAVFALVAIILVLLPTYLWLKLGGNYGTHTYQYAWLPGLAFTSHATAAITVGILWVAILSVLLVLMNISATDSFVEYQMGLHDKQRKQSLVQATSINTYVRYAMITALVMGNALATLLVNGIYVLVTLYAQRAEQYLAAVFVVIFKLNWNFGVIIPALTRFHCPYAVLTSTLVFNVVIAPVLATLAADIDCFQSLFLKPDIIFTEYSYTECEQSNPFGNNSNTCAHPNTEQSFVSFTPPLLYSDQCGSAIITNYVPVYIATQGIVPFAGWLVSVPLLAFIIADSKKKKKSGADTTTTNSSTVETAGNSAADLSSIDRSNDNVTTTTTTTTTGACTDSGYSLGVLPWLEAQESFVSKLIYRLICAAIPIRSIHDLKYKRKSIRDLDHSSTDPRMCNLYNLKVYGLNNYLKLVLMTSFGFAYPPLGIILGLNIFITTLLIQVCLHFHHVQVSAIPGALPIWEAIVSYELIDIHGILLGGRSFLALMSFCFVSIFIYDMTSTSDPTLYPTLVPCLITVILLVILWFSYMRHFHASLLRSLCSFPVSNQYDMEEIFEPKLSILEMRESSQLSKTRNKDDNCEDGDCSSVNDKVSILTSPSSCSSGSMSTAGELATATEEGTLTTRTNDSYRATSVEYNPIHG